VKKFVNGRERMALERFSREQWVERSTICSGKIGVGTMAAMRAKAWIEQQSASEANRIRLRITAAGRAALLLALDKKRLGEKL